MSEVTEQSQMTEAVAPVADEKTVLLARAKMMGIRHSPNIGVDALRAKIQAAMEAESASAPEPEKEKGETAVPPEMAAQALPGKPLTMSQLRQKIRLEALKLVRVRITCMDPKKKDLPGEIITVASKFIGTVRKFVPYGEMTDNGWHIPTCIYEYLKARKFQNIRSRKTPRGEVIESTWVPEFAIEVLPPLTEKELKQLAIQQAAAAGQL